MRHTLTALLSAASICAFAGVVPAAAQTYYPEGGPVKGLSVVPSQTAYSLPPSEETAQPGIVGSCSIIAGNRVCTDTPANGYGYGYGHGYGAYGEGGPLGAAVAAPFVAAGALAAVPFEAAGATAGALTGAPYPYAPGPYSAGPYAGGPMEAYPAGPVKGESVVPSQLAYSLPPSEQTARPGFVGSCSIIAGNRVCSAAPAIP